MSFSSVSFLALPHAQEREEMASINGSFVVTEPVQLPMVHAYKIPANDVLGAGLPTRREIEILELLGTGLSVKGVARQLAISPGTVKWHVKNIYYKLGASSREDALLKARLQKII